MKNMASVDLVRPSRDGDQFHYLWAARRCLSLLSGTKGLVAVSIEGPSEGERPATTTTLGGDEIIDIAEYYGDVDVSKATLVRYMQLKHSTRHQAQDWTASGLKKTLAGFGKRYTGLLKELGVTSLGNRVEFWFVSNRPVSDGVLEAIADAASGAPPRSAAEFGKLQRYSGLQGTSLAEFCRLIKFEAGEADYWDQRNILFQDVAGYLPEADVDAPTQLKELVTRKALSESAESPSITKIDVLRALKTDETRLFPAPCLIVTPSTILPRAQESALTKRIVEVDGQPILVHADAGVGKSIFSTQLGKLLPVGSTTIVYDCFGNGQYRNASGHRHRHGDAIVQIANELASKGLCHPLIPSSLADSKAYIGAFIHRLRQAVGILRATTPGALLCVVIDAADNAQMAAEEVGENRSFARDVIREAMPEGVRLVLTCRTHRQDLLDPPLTTLRLPLGAFSVQETEAHLRLTFPNATDHDVTEFHRLSSQNPRVQALVLSRGLSLAECLRVLGPNPSTVETTITGLLSDAIAKLKDGYGNVERAQIDRICAGLAALRPLIPITVLARISGVSEGAVRSFALDIGRPLLVSDETIQFLDEPAETWFREQFKPSADSLAEFVQTLRPLAVGSIYIAATLPQLMLEAGMFSELVSLALTASELPETSPLEKRDVELQRLHFALKASLRSKRYVEAAKLALKAGGEAAGDERQRKLVQSNTDLAGAFLDLNTLQELVSRRTFGSGWVGSHHAYEAGILSAKAELKGDARSRLRMAQEWLRNWSSLSTDRREREEVSLGDIAELAMAHLNVHGPDAAARSIIGWTPRSVTYRAGRMLASRLVDAGRFNDLDSLALAARHDPFLVLAIIRELRRVGRHAPVEVIRGAVRRVARFSSRDKQQTWDAKYEALDAVTALVESALLKAACSKPEVMAALAKHMPKQVPRGLSSRYSGHRDLLIRAYCLMGSLSGSTLKVEDLADDELRKELERNPSYGVSSETEDFKEDVGALLPWHTLVSQQVVGTVQPEILSGLISEAVKQSASALRRHYREQDFVSSDIAEIWLDLLLNSETLDASALAGLEAWMSSLRQPIPANTWCALARRTSGHPASRSAALVYAAKAFRMTQDERAEAGGKVDGYVDIARAILPASRAEAKAYFDEAVSVASKIGDENLGRWAAILDLADKAQRADRPVPETTHHFARCAEFTWDYVVRDKHFDWNGTVVALAALCPRSSLAILSRWRDRRFGRTGRILPIAVEALITNGSVDPRDTIPLISFEAGWDYSQVLSAALDKCQSRAEKEVLLNWVRQITKFDDSLSTAKSLNELAVRHGLGTEDLTCRVRYSEHEQSANLAKESDSIDLNSDPKAPDWEPVFDDNGIQTAADISRAYSRFKSTPTPWHHDAFFRELFRRVPSGAEADVVRALADVPQFDLYHLRGALEAVPENWRDRPAIQRALASTLRVFARRHCMGISKNRYYEVLPLELACKLAGMEQAELVEVVLTAVGESPDLADAARLFSLVGLLAIVVSADQALEALQFGLGLFDAEFGAEQGDGPWRQDLAPPASMSKALAGYIWAGLASPAAAVRWEAAHAVVGLFALARDEVVDALTECSRDSTSLPFCDPRLPFYHLHALQWLAISVARAATEFPMQVKRVLPELTTWITNGPPHILIRVFAARAVLAVHAKLDTEIDPATMAMLNVTTSAFPPVESKAHERMGPGTEETAEVRQFHFGMDTGQYWYQPLGRVFGLSQVAIESRALEAIRDRLGYTGNGGWDEDERQKRNLYPREGTYASHGDYPEVDVHRTYLTYHAMMIVADQLLQTMPVHSDTSWGPTDEFANWLSGHDISRPDGRWLADRRDPPPFEWPEWRSYPKGTPEHGTITKRDFEQATTSADRIHVWGYWSDADNSREQTTIVRSALVVPDRSKALLRSLFSAEDEYSYRIPSVSSDDDINFDGYVLTSWVDDHSGDRGIDRKDPWAGNISFPPSRPSSNVIEVLGLSPDSDMRTWSSNSDSMKLFSRTWGLDEDEYENRPPNHGDRLEIDPDLLLKLLRKSERDLVVSVRIERRRRYRRHERQDEDDEKRISRSKFYLYTATGDIITT